MILALDCATATGSVALVRDPGAGAGEVVSARTFATPRGRGGALFPALAEVLEEAGDLTRVVVGTGPGSYNGIRAALAAGWGIATAREIPLAGVSSLLGLAEGSYVTVGDARRGQFYFARVQGGGFLEGPALFTAGEILQKIAPEAPSGEAWPIFVPEPISFLPQAVARSPEAGRLAVHVPEDGGSGEVPEPLYLKAAHITAPAGEARKTGQSAAAGSSPE